MSIDIDIATPLVRFNPCAQFAPELDDLELCAGCGWSADDHEDEHDLAA